MTDKVEKHNCSKNFGNSYFSSLKLWRIRLNRLQKRNSSPVSCWDGEEAHCVVWPQGRSWSSWREDTPGARRCWAGCSGGSWRCCRPQRAWGRWAALWSAARSSGSGTPEIWWRWHTRTQTGWWGCWGSLTQTFCVDRTWGNVDVNIWNNSPRHCVPAEEGVAADGGVSVGGEGEHGVDAGCQRHVGGGVHHRH